MNVGDTVQILQVEVIPSLHVPPTLPTGPMDHWIYGHVLSVDSSGVAVQVAHPGNRWNRSVRRYAPADTAANVREKADVLALAATAGTPALKAHYANQAKRLGPAPTPKALAPARPTTPAATATAATSTPAAETGAAAAGAASDK